MSKSTSVSLRLVDLRRSQLEKQLAETEEQIAEDFRFLFVEESPHNKLENVVKTATKTWLFIDGTITGYKLLKRLGVLSFLFKKKR